MSEFSPKPKCLEVSKCFPICPESGPQILRAFTPWSQPVAALLEATRTVPIVFVAVIDPVGGGFVDSLARPGGNTTGFTLFEYGISGKWLNCSKSSRRA